MISGRRRIAIAAPSPVPKLQDTIYAIESGRDMTRNLSMPMSIPADAIPTQILRENRETIMMVVTMEKK